MWPIIVTLLMAMALIVARRRLSVTLHAAKDTQLTRGLVEGPSAPTSEESPLPPPSAAAAAPAVRQWTVDVVAGSCCRRRPHVLCSATLQPGQLLLETSTHSEREAGVRFGATFSSSPQAQLLAFLVETDPADPNVILLSDRDELNHRRAVDRATIVLSQPQQQALVAPRTPKITTVDDDRTASLPRRLGVLVQYAHRAAVDGATPLPVWPGGGQSCQRLLTAPNSPSALLLFASREERFMFVEELNVVVHAHLQAPTSSSDGGAGDRRATTSRPSDIAGPAEAASTQPPSRASWASLLTTVGTASSTAPPLSLVDCLVNRLLRLSSDDAHGMATMWQHLLAPRLDHLPNMVVRKGSPDVHVALASVTIPDGCDPFPTISNVRGDSTASAAASGVGADGALHLRATAQCDGLQLRFGCRGSLPTAVPRSTAAVGATAAFYVDVRLVLLAADVRCTLQQPPSEFLWLACAAPPRCTIAVNDVHPASSVWAAHESVVQQYFKETLRCRLFADGKAQQPGATYLAPVMSKLSLRSGTSIAAHNDREYEGSNKPAPSKEPVAPPLPPSSRTPVPFASRSPAQTLPFIATHSYITIVEREVRIAYELKREMFNVSQQLLEEDALFRRRVHTECVVMQRRSEELQRISRGLETQTLELQRQRQDWHRERGDAAMDAQVVTALSSARGGPAAPSNGFKGGSGSNNSNSSLPSSVEATPDRSVRLKPFRDRGPPNPDATAVSPPRSAQEDSMPCLAPPPPPSPPLVRQLSARCDSSNTTPKAPPSARSLMVSGLPVPSTRGVRTTTTRDQHSHAADGRDIHANSQRPTVPALQFGHGGDAAIIVAEGRGHATPSIRHRPPPVVGAELLAAPPPPSVLPSDVPDVALSARSDAACSSVHVSSTSSPRLVHGSNTKPSGEGEAHVAADAPINRSETGGNATEAEAGGAALLADDDAPSSSSSSAPSADLDRHRLAATTPQASAPTAPTASSSLSSSSSDGLERSTEASNDPVATAATVGTTSGAAAAPVASAAPISAGDALTDAAAASSPNDDDAMLPAPSLAATTMAAQSEGAPSHDDGGCMALGCTLGPRVHDVLVAERARGAAASRHRLRHAGGGAVEPLAPLHDRLLEDLTEALRMDCSVTWRVPRSSVVIRGLSIVFDPVSMAAALARGCSLPDALARRSVTGSSPPFGEAWLVGDVSLATQNRRDVGRQSASTLAFREVQSVVHVFGAQQAPNCGPVHAEGTVNAISSAANASGRASTTPEPAGGAPQPTSARQRPTTPNNSAAPLTQSPRQVIASGSASSTPRHLLRHSNERGSPTSSSPQVEKLRLAREAAAAQFSAIQRQGAALSARGTRSARAAVPEGPVAGPAVSDPLSAYDPLLTHKMCLVQCEESSRRADTEVAAFQFVASVRRRSAMQLGDAAVWRRVAKIAAPNAEGTDHHPTALDGAPEDVEGATFIAQSSVASLQQVLRHDEECLRHAVVALEASKWASMVHGHTERLRRHCAVKIAQCAAEERRKRSLLAQIAAAAYIDTLHALQRHLLHLPLRDDAQSTTTTTTRAMLAERILQKENEAADIAAAAAAAEDDAVVPLSARDANGPLPTTDPSLSDVTALWSDWCVDTSVGLEQRRSVQRTAEPFHYATFVPAAMERYHTGVAAIGAMMLCLVKRDLTMGEPMDPRCVFEAGDVLLDIDNIALHSHQHMRQVLSDRAMRIQARLLEIEPDAHVWTAGHYAPLRLEEVLSQEFAMEALVIRHSDVITVTVTT